MLAYRCDKCGSFFERNTKPLIDVIKNTPTPEKHIDLCFDCTRELDMWLKRRNKE